jgi:hypothetical protein
MYTTRGAERNKLFERLHSLFVWATIETHKAEALWVEVELYFTDRTVTVLSNDEVGDVLDFGVIWLVVTRAIDETHDVGVLLDGTGFTQVGKLWNRRGAVFDATAQLT